MSHQAVLQWLASLFLVCAVIVIIIDIATELNFKLALQMKWAFIWYFARYTALVCAFLMALDILTRDY